MILRLPLEFGNAFPRGEQCQRDKLGTFRAQPQRLGFVQFTPHDRVHQRIWRLRRPWLHTLLHTSAWTIAQVAYFNISPPHAALQTAEELRFAKKHRPIR